MKKLLSLQEMKIMMRKVKEKRKASVKPKMEDSEAIAINNSTSTFSSGLDTNFDGYSYVETRADVKAKADKYELIKAKYKEEGITTLDMMRFLSQVIDGKEPPVRQRRE
ncbi:hypothetical protein [Shouchella clausii]|uniref:hypothetical protein n=1 Tax=Shouchella clausii TaxID=79880 RepID=UPI001C72FC9E|nr:hypothetical protein [Shouchella clausii]MBX0320273.1 hypothetical protein [Shouchella clausii]